jgi:hypothetical protein
LLNRLAEPKRNSRLLEAAGWEDIMLNYIIAASGSVAIIGGIAYSEYRANNGCNWILGTLLLSMCYFTVAFA